MNIKTPKMPEPDFTLNWRGWGYTVTKPAVGDTNVYTADQLSARDAQWLEMVRPVVEALSELEEAYCRAGPPLNREERAQDRKRLINARAALSQIKGE
jgi:hypothetical protein